jgi:hypothetical protein
MSSTNAPVSQVYQKVMHKSWMEMHRSHRKKIGERKLTCSASLLVLQKIEVALSAVACAAIWGFLQGERLRPPMADVWTWLLEGDAHHVRHTASPRRLQGFTPAARDREWLLRLRRRLELVEKIANLGLQMLRFAILPFLTLTLQNWVSKHYPLANYAFRCISPLL